MHLEGRRVPDGPQARRITGSQHMGLQLLQEGAGDERYRAAGVSCTGAFSMEAEGETDTAGVCMVIEWVCYVYMLNLYAWI